MVGELLFIFYETFSFGLLLMILIDFSIPGASNAFGYVPSPSNYIKPGKRPLSSITPTIVTHPDGELYFVTGAAGGSRIITATILSLVNTLDRGMDSHDSLAEPRLHDQLIPNQLFLEKTFDTRTVNFLKGRGHNVTFMLLGSSAVQAVRLLPNGTFEAAGEPRQFASGGFAL
jgi:gamma-glutamyltranspeptidase/glutathione hydrolase